LRKENRMEREKIVKAVKSLNKSGLAKGEIRVEDIEDDKDLMDAFLVAVETVNKEDEEKLPKVVGDTYNALVDELEGNENTEESQPNNEKEESKVAETNRKNGKNGKKTEPVKETPPKEEKKAKGGKKESALEFGRRLFKGGKTKDEVKKALINLYMTEKAADEKFAAARAAAIYRTVSKEK